MTSDNDKSVPSEAMMIMLAPDGYYTYLQIPKQQVPSSSPSDSKAIPQETLDVIKKNYRKLSIKHHPDKPGGDVDTFRLLKRAQTVLSSPKLKQQYDILGLDLDDDEEDDNTGGNNDNNSGEDGGGPEPQTTSQGIVHEIASMALTAVLQTCVRTGVLAFASIFVTRYLFLLVPALGVLAFVAYQIRKSTVYAPKDLLSPFLIGTGLILMYQASVGSWKNITQQDEDGSTITTAINFWWYWLGESMVIFMFTFNSLGPTQQAIPVVVGMVAIFGILAALWFRGKFWNYAIVLGLEVFAALFIAVSFPVFEMILEAILNDKLKKVGDKVRAQHAYMEKYYSTTNRRKQKD